MATATQSQAPRDPFGETQVKAIEAMSAYAQANQRVLGELIELSSAAAKETLRVWAELESVALAATRTASGQAPTPPATIEDFTRDPLAGYRMGVLAAGEMPQRLMKLFDSNGQIIGQGVQRFQASAEKSGKGIREAVTSYFNRIGEIYGRS
jgi:hypothetical protein